MFCTEHKSAAPLKQIEQPKDKEHSNDAAGVVPSAKGGTKEQQAANNAKVAKEQQVPNDPKGAKEQQKSEQKDAKVPQSNGDDKTKKKKKKGK